MAKQNKSWETLWRTSFNKSDLSNAVIKLLKTSNRSFRYDPMLIMPEYKTIGKIREALLNPKTKAEAAFIALASRFESPHNFNALLRRHKRDGRVLYVRMVHSKKFGNYFKLEYETLSGERKAYTPNKAMKDTMKRYRPKAPKNPALLESMRMSNIKAQNVNLWKGEVCKFLVSLTDMVASCVMLHDPTNKYGSPQALTDEQLYDDGDVRGTPNLTRYIEDLNHMRKQWQSFLPLANTLGINTQNITDGINKLIDAASNISEYEYDYDPIESMYDVNEMGLEVIEDIHSMASNIQELALSDEDLTKVRKNASIPMFKDYSPSKISAHQTSIAGVTDRIKDMVAKLSKAEFSFRD